MSTIFVRLGQIVNKKTRPRLRGDAKAALYMHIYTIHFSHISAVSSIF